MTPANTLIGGWEAAGLVRCEHDTQLSYSLRALGHVAHGLTTGGRERVCYTTPEGAVCAEMLARAPKLMHMRRANMVAKLVRDPVLRAEFCAAYALDAHPKILRDMLEQP